eukprot:scaffold21632_cov62-Phaeocystis_antarctica.AAC.11
MIGKAAGRVGVEAERPRVARQRRAPITRECSAVVRFTVLLCVLGDSLPRDAARRSPQALGGRAVGESSSSLVLRRLARVRQSIRVLACSRVDLQPPTAADVARVRRRLLQCVTDGAHKAIDARGLIGDELVATRVEHRANHGAHHARAVAGEHDRVRSAAWQQAFFDLERNVQHPHVPPSLDWAPLHHHLCRRAQRPHVRLGAEGGDVHNAGTRVMVGRGCLEVFVVLVALQLEHARVICEDHLPCLQRVPACVREDLGSHEVALVHGTRPELDAHPSSVQRRVHGCVVQLDTADGGGGNRHAVHAQSEGAIDQVEVVTHCARHAHLLALDRLLRRVAPRPRARLVSLPAFAPIAVEGVRREVGVVAAEVLLQTVVVTWETSAAHIPTCIGPRCTRHPPGATVRSAPVTVGLPRAEPGARYLQRAVQHARLHVELVRAPSEARLADLSNGRRLVLRG